MSEIVLLMLAGVGAAFIGYTIAVMIRDFLETAVRDLFGPF